MSYLVLARKYRPQTFAEVVGQAHVTRTLTNAFTQDRVHHAFLFCGPRGVGKTTAARILGKALNCANGPTAEPCGKCEPCESIASGTAVDYFEMDGASNRGIDAIRELTEAVRYQPALLRKKVYVIDEVHMLTTEAFNALLKTLEEPPPHVAFVMATTEPHKVPNTILSRCQRYDFKLVPSPVLCEHLEEIFRRENIEVEAAAIALIVRESGGSVRDAMSLCDQVISYVGADLIRESAVAEVLGVADRALTSGLVTALAGGDAKTALKSADQAIARGIGETQLVRAVVRHLRDLAVTQVGATVAGGEANPGQLQKEAAAIDPNRVRQMFERMLRACDDLGQSQQPRLLLDLAFIDVATLDPLLPLGELVGRLGDLERKLERGGKGGGGGGQKPPGQRSQRETIAEAPTAPSISNAPAPAPPPAPRGPAQSAPAPTGPEGAEPSPATTAAPVEPPPPATQSPAPQTAEGSSRVPIPESALTGGLTVDDFQLWEGVIGALEDERKLSLVRLFQEAKLLKVDASTIEVGYPADGLDAELAAERAKNMAEFICGHLGRPLDFKVRQLSPSELAKASQGARSLVELRHDADRQERESRALEAREHPATKIVLDAFGATIKEIKTNV